MDLCERLVRIQTTNRAFDCQHMEDKIVIKLMKFINNTHTGVNTTTKDSDK